MDIKIIIPLLLGWLVGWGINYLADVLPHAMRLGRPVCQNKDCLAVYNWWDYLSFHRCRSCGIQRIGRRLLVHVLCLGMSIYLWFQPQERLGFWLSCLVFNYLLLIGLIDLEHRLILRPLSIAGLLLATAAGTLLHGWKSMLIGGAAGFSIMFVFYLLGILFSRLRSRKMSKENIDNEEALGSGDVTLLTVLGLLTGWPLITFVLVAGIFLSGIVSLVIVLVLAIRKRYKRQALMMFIPMGPFFLIATILVLFFSNWIIILAG